MSQKCLLFQFLKIILFFLKWWYSFQNVTHSPITWTIFFLRCILIVKTHTQANTASIKHCFFDEIYSLTQLYYVHALKHYLNFMKQTQMYKELWWLTSITIKKENKRVHRTLHCSSDKSILCHVTLLTSTEIICIMIINAHQRSIVPSLAIFSFICC
jgi:hypothetical protein